MAGKITGNGNGGRRAIVVGAGIAGLATALRLHRSGWRVLIVERAPARRSSGYMVNLLGSGYDAGERLGLLPELKKRDLGVFTSILVRADGSAKLTVPAAIVEAAVGSRAMSLFRGDLESVLYEAVEHKVELRFGTTVASISQGADRFQTAPGAESASDGDGRQPSAPDADGAEAALGANGFQAAPRIDHLQTAPGTDGLQIVLSDGTTEQADLLIGADGLHSSTRRLVFGPESDFRVDLHHMVGAFPLHHVPRDLAEGSGTTFIGPGRTAAVVNLGPGRSSAFFTYRSDDPEADLEGGPAEALAGAFGDLGGGVPAALDQLRSDPDSAYFDSVSQIAMDSWSRGRVVLLGDAAWCVTLFAGYGAALALSGADLLGDALDDHGDDIAAALADWESRLRPETRKRQATARRGIAQFAPPTKAHIWMNEMMMRAITLPGIRHLVQRAIRASS